MSMDFTELHIARDNLAARLAEIFSERVTLSDLDKEIAKSIPAGAPGQVPFIKNDGSRISEVDYLVHKGAFCNTAAEVTSAKGVVVDNETIFNSWHRFSHDATENQPALPADITSWSYDGPTDTFNNTTNSESYAGVVSVKKYSSYELEVRLSSTGVDDDAIGVVLAWYVDPDTGREYTLSAVRSQGGNVPTWAIIYNNIRSDSYVVASGNTLVKWGNGNFGATRTEAGYNPLNIGEAGTTGWDDFPTGTKIKVTREGDVINVRTSQWDNPDVYDPATELSVDLASDSRLLKFRGPRQYGYAVRSQPFSKWEVLSSTDLNNIIYDLGTGQVWKYNAGASTWVVDATASISKDIGLGRILFNPTTKKCFYVDGDGLISLLGDL